MSEFSSAVTDKSVFGDRRIHYGTFNSSGATGGPLNTRLKRIQFITFATYRKGDVTGVSGVVSGASISGGTTNALPVSGGTIEMLCPAGASGAWFAFGV